MARILFYRKVETPTTISGHIYGASDSAPTLNLWTDSAHTVAATWYTAETGGSSSTAAPVVTAGATDTRGKITFGTGTGPAAGAQVVVTFATAYAAAPYATITPLNAATAALQPRRLGCNNRQRNRGLRRGTSGEPGQHGVCDWFSGRRLAG